MSTLQAFIEVGYTLVAVVIPGLALILIILFAGAILVDSWQERRRRAAVDPFDLENAMGFLVESHFNAIGTLVGLLVVAMLWGVFLLCFFLATLPYGASHGWW